MRTYRIYIIISLAFLLFVFMDWILPGILSSGDWVYYYPSAIADIAPFSIWDSRHLGLGASKLPTLWLESYFALSVKSALLIGWQLYERLFWFFPFLAFGVISSYILARKIIGNSIFLLLAPVIYITNTYALLLVGGGQMGVALAYSFAPFVVYMFYEIIFSQTFKLKKSLVAGLAFAVLTMFDIRLAYIIAGLVFIMFVAENIRNWNSWKIFLKKLSYAAIIPVIIVIGIHFYWILPILLFRTNPINLLGEEYTGVNSVKFFSFANLENTISLLHPNWPENIFGKVYFLRPQHLLVPILAFTSILVANRAKQGLPILLFSLVSLVGVFLAKGANEPFGGLYLWMFEYIPGFKMFRDPTKWYLLIAIGFSILIPYALSGISRSIRYLKNKSGLIFLVFLAFWIFLMRDVFTINKGTFTSHSIHNEYRSFSNMLEEDTQFYRTLWIPIPHRFGYHSSTHPAVLFKEVATEQSVEDFFGNPQSEDYLRERSIRYVVVPIDTAGELFLDDRKYSDKVRQKVISILSETAYLTMVNSRYNSLAVFELRDPYPHFFTFPEKRSVTSGKISPTLYMISVGAGTMSGKLVFSENFDRNWTMRINAEAYGSASHNSLNSFPIGKEVITAEVIYEPQKDVWLGVVVSGVTILFVLVFLIRK